MPNNLNFSQSNDFVCGTKELPESIYMIQRVSIPSIDLSPMELNSRAGAKFTVAGDTLTFGTLDLELLLDENYKSYKELYQLLVKHVSLEKGTFGDFQFEFWVEGTNSMGNSKIKWEFHNCRFQSFGSVDFSTTDDLTERTFNISLKFDYYEVIFSDLPTLKI